MHPDTGRFRELELHEELKPDPETGLMEIPFKQGEIITIKGHPFRIRSINATTHELTLRSAKYKPMADPRLAADLDKAESRVGKLKEEIERRLRND